MEPNEDKQVIANNISGVTSNPAGSAAGEPPNQSEGNSLNLKPVRLAGTFVVVVGILQLAVLPLIIWLDLDYLVMGIVNAALALVVGLIMIIGGRRLRSVNNPGTDLVKIRQTNRFIIIAVLVLMAFNLLTGGPAGQFFLLLLILLFWADRVLKKAIA